MRSLRKHLAGIGLTLTGSVLIGSLGLCQANLPVAATGDQVIIKREACRVVEPSKYRVPLSLEAIHTVTLVAPFDGTVRQIPAKVNAKVQSEGEVLRLDQTLQKLRLNRAQAAMKVASLELRHVEKDEAATALAQAKIDLAKVDVEIAQSILDQATIRMPFSGEVQRILVTEGQFVRAGDAVAIVADMRSMKVELPVERAAADNGKSLKIKVEADEVEAKIDAVLPLPSKFEGLRDLFDSIASVQLVIDNTAEKLKVGQTVYAPLIPRQPVVEVANSAVLNQPDGTRKVQVVRLNVVRDVPVTLMGQVGNSRVFVSGAFAEGDEVIYESSHLLGDAFQLKAATPTTTASPAGTTTNPKPPAQTGF